MLNQIVLVGRICNDTEIKELESGKKVVNITLAVPRPYKNADGVYETDFFNCSVWEGNASRMNEYCKKGDLIGIKGHLYSKTKDGKNEINISAEKVTFISSRNMEKRKEDELSR